MACGSGCCAPPPGQSQGPGSGASPKSDQVEMKDAYSIENDTLAADGSYKVAGTADKDTYQGACCTADASHFTCCADGQAAGTRQSESDSGCDDTCCSKEIKTLGSPADAPACCEGKPSPCCDISCLDRLAVRECQQQRGTSHSESRYAPILSTTLAGPALKSPATESFISPACTAKAKDGRPCEEHTRSTREKYGAKLQALGCLCRALLALGQESCCPPPQRSSLERKCSSKKPAVALRKSVDSCCATGLSRDSSVPSVRARSKGKGCVQDTAKVDHCTKERCAPVQNINCCSTSDLCCANTEKSAPGAPKAKCQSLTPDGQFRDLENGLSGKEHVILSISGMTCTGCETKLQMSLAKLSSVKHLKTSLLLSRAEFDLDLSGGTVSEVMKHLERTTEFKCEKVSHQGSNVDLITPCNAYQFITRDWPIGVTDMTVIGKNTVNVAFDVKIIGARDLVDRGWDSPLCLASPRADPTLDAGSKHVRNIGIMTILSALLTIPVLVMAWAPLPQREIAYGSASLTLATLVQFLIAGPFYPKALKALIFSHVVEMDLLIVLSTTAAYVFSVVSFGYLVSGQPLSTGNFFETSTLLVTLIMLGRYVAAIARQKAVESISVRSLQASTAILVKEEGAREIDVRLLQHGDIFKVPADSKIPTDGTVISGSSEVDESMVTGESRPVEKYVKSAVIAGSVNGPGPLLVRLDRLPGDNTISAIANMVDEAKLSKPKLQGLADRVASYFVPVVVSLTIITFSIWVAVGVTVQGKSGSEAIIQAITFAITVLIVSCPCAVGLAIPMVIVIASGAAAERGVIIKSASTIEIAHKTSHVVLDKTGTLTEGRLTIAHQVYFGDKWSLDRSQRLLLALLANNSHPVSVAVAARLQGNSVSPSPEITEANLKVLTGKGIEASTSSGLILRAGNSRWLNLSTNHHVQSILSEGFTTFCFTINDSIAAVFGLEDSLRPDALSTIAQLHKRGIAVHVISGDDDAAVRSVANRLAIPYAQVRSRCTPADKGAYVQSLLSDASPSKQRTVMFCGDGTNDAVALAQATIGVHINDSSGTDVAKAAADVVLMRASLAGILTLLAVSRRSVRRIAFNFGWSAVYNLFAVLLGGGAFAALHGARIPPAFAGLGELVSVLPVVLAAVMLRWEHL